MLNRVRTEKWKNREAETDRQSVLFGVTFSSDHNEVQHERTEALQKLNHHQQRNVDGSEVEGPVRSISHQIIKYPH